MSQEMLHKYPTRQAAIEFVSTLVASNQDVFSAFDGTLIDHLCYRVESLDRYEALKAFFSSEKRSDLSGVLLTEASVNGRPIATYRLQKPLNVGGFSIECLELPAPKAGKKVVEGFEHVEVVVRKDLSSIASVLNLDAAPLGRPSLNTELAVSRPQGVIKFHQLPLSYVIAIEESKICKEMTRELLDFLWLLKPLVLLRDFFPPQLASHMTSDAEIHLFSESRGASDKWMSDLAQFSLSAKVVFHNKPPVESETFRQVIEYFSQRVKDQT